MRIQQRVYNLNEILCASISNVMYFRRCTIIYGTPTMYVDLVARQKELGLPIDSAEIALTGGAPCSPQLYKNIKTTFGLKKVKVKKWF